MKFSTSVKLAAVGFEVLTAENHFSTEKVCRNADFNYCGMLVVRGDDGVWYSRRDDNADTILDGVNVEQIQTWRWDHCGDGFAWRLATYVHIDKDKGWREVPNPEAIEPDSTDIEIDETYLNVSKVKVKMVPINAIKTLTHAKKSIFARLFNR